MLRAERKHRGKGNNARETVLSAPVSHQSFTSKESPNMVLDGISGLAIQASPKVTEISQDRKDNPDQGIPSTESPSLSKGLDRLMNTGVESLCSPRSPSNPNSDDEIIIFSGRAHGKSQPREWISDTSPLQSTAVKDTITVPRDMSLRNVRSIDPEAAACQDLSIRKERKKSRRNYIPDRIRPKPTMKQDADEAVVADYISNVRGTDGPNDSFIIKQFQNRDLALDNWTEPIEAFSIDEAVDLRVRGKDDWDSIDLQDFEGLSSSSEPMRATPRILRRRLRKSEKQYLVVASGESVDEARWLNRELLRAPAASELVDAFDEEQSRKQHLLADGASSEASSTEDTAGDEADLKERHRVRVSDERVARLLSKQVDLGMAGEDLVLFDGHGLEDASDDVSNENVIAIRDAVASSTSSKLPAKSKKQSRLRLSSAHSTSDQALDANDGFDVMEFERPSLRRRAKGTHPSEHVLNLSDSDLQQSMLTAWQSDRTKKKQRKLERELLRAQGLLGIRTKRDSRIPPVGNAAMGDISRDIKGFLQSSAASCSLPPMGARERKIIHSIAYNYGLTSKSRGSGAARFPVLYRTLRTKPFTPRLEAEINALFTQKRSGQRPDNPRRRGAYPSRSGPEGADAAASYRDGEVVGIGAPEISTENKGRSMLERMGWSTGNSLGADKNKGISQPIQQIVKTSKAGLG